MKQTIIAFNKDELGDWVAALKCGHYQHVRHNPPWINRHWTTTKQGRKSKLGEQLNCKKCDENALKTADN